MISLPLNTHYSSTLLSFKVPPPSPSPSPSNLRTQYYTYRFSTSRYVVKKGICRAELSQDAPFAIAIGTCILSSLVLATPARDEEDADSVIDSTDTRLAAMGIISFIPYFNWLSWVFAWLDTGKRRYAVYSLVYLIPYLRSNLSLSPEESWLPIASIVFCIIHVQLEASIRNGDLQGFQLFGKTERNCTSLTKEKANYLDEQQQQQDTLDEGRGRKEGRINLPQAGKDSRDEVSEWGVPKKPLKHPEHEDADDDRRRKH